MKKQNIANTIAGTMGINLGRLLKWASESTPEDAKIFYHEAFGYAEMTMELGRELGYPELETQAIQSWEKDWKPRFERYLF